MKILRDRNHRNDKFLKTKSNNILTAWKFLLLFYQLAMLKLFNHFNYYRKEKGIAASDKLFKFYRRYNI